MSVRKVLLGPLSARICAHAPLARPPDYSTPANDKIFDAAAYEKFLIDHIKVEGKTGQLGDDIKISTEGASCWMEGVEAERELTFFFVYTVPGQLAIISSIPFSKRYLKYLTKRFLKKNVRALASPLPPATDGLLTPPLSHSSCASGSVSSRPRRTPTPSGSSTSLSTPRTRSRRLLEKALIADAWSALDC